MTTTLIVTSLCLLLVGAVVGVTGVREARVRHWLSGTIRGRVAMLLLALAALVATVTVGLQGYRALTYEEVAATVRTEPVAPQRFRATITLPDRRLAMYELARSKPVDLFFIARRRLLGPLVDAEYGSATFVAATRAQTFEVRVSMTGLLARPIPSGNPR